ncbi:MAG: site-2 protease family protein [Actinomycetaceae bacterium]|nr:site-2 protease family protein [Actinomycetaceae bacterium]MDY5854849.1 site-2 protease family protein [Arcanobacterium sp.]
MTSLLTMLGIVLFVVGLLVTVGLHELGHLLPAKKFGVKVPKYFIGFGPTLWSVRRGGTEYGVKAIPLGGFVELAGMLAPAPAGVRVRKADGEPTAAEQARLASAAQLEPGEEHRAFWRLPARKKLIVMFGGPCVNAVLAVVLTVGVLCGIGAGVYGTKLASVQQCVGGAATCAAQKTSPAALAGLREGDQILAWGNTDVDSWEDVQAAIARGGTAPVSVQVRRPGDDDLLTLTLSPILTERPVLEGDGRPAIDPTTGQERTELKPYVGISPQLEMRRQSLGVALLQVGKLAVGTIQIVALLPVKLWDTAVQLFSGAPRDANSVVGIVGIADMAGTITSAQVSWYGFAQRTADFLMLMASLNMSLFVFNLIPLLPLDGGHILGALIEGVRRTWARWRGRPDPGAFDTARLLPLSYAVIAFFVVMTLLLVVADIVNPVI